ncbi:IclR family transcriptional regulator [Thermanaerothrix sp. 4228-RoL]|uniref:IclR family transcriptional regulator n=1 Tax=Thermanaerothrix solaris TaxID=3058434 RepID=A0ABU3NPI6_9CHLR|nr:IclR family transcriptional regulator [Thermanaerothrix sp. 4228-RoL]MDT8898751.1 IclR family transcriptional regulator [Thermanaerothrix sp. 4228-RoL]
MLPEKVQLLERIACILDCFNAESRQMGVRQVARKINLSVSTTGRLMQAMREMGLLVQDPTTSLYGIGPRVLSWADAYLANLDVRTLALPHLQALHRETMETISLYILDGDARICVERLESPHSLRLVAPLGQRLPLYAGSAGKVLLAFLPRAEQEALLEQMDLQPLTPYTITDRGVLLRELETIRAQGYAISHGEWIAEANGVSVPIFDRNHTIHAAITISGPAQRLTDEKIATFLPQLLAVAREISLEMGWRPLTTMTSLTAEETYARTLER